MFSKLCTLLSILSLTNALLDRQQSGDYYIGQFNGDEFAQPFDVCNPTDVVASQGYQMASCSEDGSYITWGNYDDAACTSLKAGTTTTFNDSTGTGIYGDFVCGTNNSYYSAVSFIIGSCDGTSFSFTAAVGACALVTGLGQDDASEYISLELACELGITELQYFDSANTGVASCTDDNFYQVRNATDTCDWILTSGTLMVYGEQESCVGGPVDIGDSDSASSLSLVGALVAGIFVALSM
jgi:hypothetical protein